MKNDSKDTGQDTQDKEQNPASPNPAVPNNRAPSKEELEAIEDDRNQR